MQHVAPTNRALSVLHLSPIRLPANSAKDGVGAALLLAVGLVAAISIRLYADGPDWGLQLGQAADGGVVATAVRGHGVAWEQHVRSGDRVLAIDGVDALQFVDRQIGPAKQLNVSDAGGNIRTVRPPEVSEALKLWLPGVAVLFALLGAVVYRWTVDTVVARVFLVLSGATALALASMAGALYGYALTHFVAASSATVASATFTMLFLWFPRPIRGASWLTAALAVFSAGLVAPLFVVYGRGQGTPPLLETSLFGWMFGNLIVGALLLAWRAVNPAQRHVLAPLALGVGVGIFPLAFLDALPQVLGRTPIMWADSASISVAAIPLAFAYSILRHRLFALDAHVRQFIFRGCAALALVAMFVPTWLTLRAIGMEDQLAMLAGVLGVALAAPTVFTRTFAVLESWFYPPLGVARAGLTTDALASSSSIAKAFVVRARELVPARWVALMLLDPTTAREGPGWACIASDGELPPTWPASDRLVVLANLAKEIVGVAVLPFDGSPTLSMAVCVGQRLDGTPPGGIDIETIQLLAMRVLPSVEAGVLRERTLAQARFREGLWELARELAAVGPETDVLRVTARHGAALLGAELATVLRRQTTDGQAYVPVAGMPELDNPDELSSVVQLDMEARDQSGYVSYLNLPDQYSMLVCWLGAAEPAEALMVLVRHTPFTDEDARRAVEIAEHAAGALRRSHLFAFADETRAQHEVDRLRNELVSTVTYEIRSPLTAVLGYAQMLRQRSESLTSYDIARIARQIELSAAATRDIVHDLSTTPLHGAGREQVRIRSVDLSQAIPRIAQRFRALPGGDRIIVDVEAGLSTRADLSRLDQIVGNLLLNALEHPAPGQVVVRASAASSSEVWIEVGHQGPAEGLAAMRSLAELHGGRVELATNQQGNSTFRVTLPRAS